MLTDLKEFFFVKQLTTFLYLCCTIFNGRYLINMFLIILRNSIIIIFRKRGWFQLPYHQCLCMSMSFRMILTKMIYEIKGIFSKLLEYLVFCWLQVKQCLAKACNIFGVSWLKPHISKNPFMSSVRGISKSGVGRVKFTTTYLLKHQIKANCI